MLLKNQEFRLDREFLPEHVAIIMDGNRRWAKKRLLQRKAGHYEGAKNLKKIIGESIKLEIKYLTVYAFSAQNWHRNDSEVDELITLLSNFLKGENKDIIDNEIKINILGDVTKFSQNIQQKLEDIRLKTEKFNKLYFNIALNYGSREEIVFAINSFLQKNVSKNNITEEEFVKYLYTHDMPDPDLVIRTGSECRLSNFLLWQAAYSELYFTRKLWPEFSEKEFHKALLDYAKRKRRFGR